MLKKKCSGGVAAASMQPANIGAYSLASLRDINSYKKIAFFAMEGNDARHYFSNAGQMQGDGTAFHLRRCWLKFVC
jgi:hypothetical protein